MKIKPPEKNKNSKCQHILNLMKMNALFMIIFCQMKNILQKVISINYFKIFTVSEYCIILYIKEINGCEQI